MMKLIEIDNYRYYDPLNESARVVLNQMGETYTPEYISGISGAAFKIAIGCPSRPTCVYDFWPADLLRLMGYEVEAYLCTDSDGNDITDKMIEAVKRQIDNGRTAIVWHAFRELEWDVVSGYDDETKQFIGKGTMWYDDYAKEPWDRAKTGEMSFGARLIGNKISTFNAGEAEIKSLEKAVAHGRKEKDSWDVEGIQAYKKWVEKYSNPGADRDVADSYCYDTYSSGRKAAVIYLHGLAEKYGGDAATHLNAAADSFEIEVNELEKARPYICWESPWGVNEERSTHLALILANAAAAYEKGIGFIEKALEYLK